jgi:Nuclease-related domain/Type III restriction enzyme, res subunit
MAKMIPPHWHDKTPNSEQRVFRMLENDPATQDWVVLHSLHLKQTGTQPYGEVDFVVLIPCTGVLCLEVKGGRVACRDDVWTSTDGAGNTHTLKRNPFQQAQDGTYEVRKALELRLAHVPEFYKVAFGHVVIFTDVEAPPAGIATQPWEVIDCQGLNKAAISGYLLKAAKQQRARLGIRSAPAQPQPALVRQMRDLLRPDFEPVLARGTVVNDSERRLVRLTEEQYYILDLFSANPRCLFEGAAGTGKTILALEFARRCAKSGNRVLLICFNKLLGEWFANEIRDTAPGVDIVCGRFYKCLRDVIVNSPIAVDFLDAERRSGDTELFGEVYPFYGQLALEGNDSKFDMIIMDEAQDLVAPAILEVLSAWVRGGLQDGRWAFFGDFHRQAIYETGKPVNAHEVISAICPSYARAALSQNCRNTRRIAEETALLSGFESLPYRMGQVDGAPVDYQNYDSAAAQQKALERILTRFAGEPDFGNGEVVILSKYRLERSAADKLTETDSFRIRPADQTSIQNCRKPTFLFATAQAFKGMESKVIVLCDVERIESDEDRSLLYVAMSRARSLLTVILHERTKAAVHEAFKKRMSELWR